MAYSSIQNLPPMEGLLAALAVLRLGSFTAAADELGVTHAAISRRIALVEEWAGKPLFARHGRGARPTPNGQRILSRAGNALEQIALLGRQETKSGVTTVRLAVTPSFARFWLFPRLKPMLEALPDVRVEVVADLKHADLTGGEVDLAIRYGRGGWRSGNERRLFDDSLVPVVEATRWRQVENGHADAVLKLPLLHDADHTNWKVWSEVHCGRITPSKPADRVLLDYALTMDAAANGLGVALWNSVLHPLLPGLLALEDWRVTGPMSFFLLRRAGDDHTPAAKVAECIRQECALS